MKTYRYDAVFFDYMDHGSWVSACAAVPVINSLLAPSSVLDVGSGRGVWTRAWADIGCPDVMAVDGSYVDKERLWVPAEKFREADLNAPFDLGRKFDLAQCLEVAEHLHPAASEGLIDSLCRHAPVVLFSAAVPGQGGENHINEKPLNDWVVLFERRGFKTFDIVRPQLRKLHDVEPWYRYNALVFIDPHKRPDLAECFAPYAYRPSDSQAGVPLLWRLRCALLSLLPRPVIEQLAVLKHAFLISLRKRDPSLPHLPGPA